MYVLYVTFHNIIMTILKRLRKYHFSYIKQKADQPASEYLKFILCGGVVKVWEKRIQATQHSTCVINEHSCVYRM